MKSVDPGLISLLQDESGFVFCDNYTFTLTSGEILRYTTCDTDVSDTVLRKALFSSAGPFFDSLQSKSQAHWRTGLDVDTWQVYVTPLAADPVTGTAFPAKIGGQPWLAAVRAGALRGAIVDIDRAFWPRWPTPWRTPFVPVYVLKDVFAGRVAAIDLMASTAILSINSHLELFNTAMPLNLFQAACRHTLFDPGCTLQQGNFGWNSAAGTGSTTSTVVLQAGVPAAFNYALGQVIWTSGANKGFSRQIKRYDGTHFYLLAPMPFPVAAGDLFTAYPGCDKTIATCNGTFGNKLNFGGEPDIPAPETAI